MDTARAEQIINELKYITSTIYTGHVAEFKPSATLLERRIKPSELPFIKKDASGQALYYIIQGRAGVDIGKKERIMIFPRQSVGEISMISTVLNTFNNLGNLESRCADVYAEEPLQLLVYN
ncbi:MAG: hypothetical protein U9N45_03095, partial [Gemmatimonadota bacterium]|nr:hypothetical protein [Gemmatimonadota bacterium]